MYQNIYYDRRINKMHVWDDKFGHQTFRYKKYAYVKNRAGTYISLYGDKLKRINKWDKDQPELFESDVNPEIRVLVDNYTDSDDVSIGHCTMIFDIEVEVTDGFPDVNKAENKITSIAFNDPLTDEYFCYVLDQSNKLKLSDDRIKVDGKVTIKSNLSSIFLTSFTSCKLYCIKFSKSFSYKSFNVPSYSILVSPTS